MDDLTSYNIAAMNLTIFFMIRHETCTLISVWYSFYMKDPQTVFLYGAGEGLMNFCAVAWKGF